MNNARASLGLFFANNGLCAGSSVAAGPTTDNLIPEENRGENGWNSKGKGNVRGSFGAIIARTR